MKMTKFAVLAVIALLTSPAFGAGVMDNEEGTVLCAHLTDPAVVEKYLGYAPAHGALTTEQEASRETSRLLDHARLRGYTKIRTHMKSERFVDAQYRIDETLYHPCVSFAETYPKRAPRK